MRDQTRNQLYTAATTAVIGGVGYYIAQKMGLENSNDPLASVVPTMLKYVGLTGLAFSAGLGVRGLLETWLDRVPDSTPRQPRP